MPNKKCNPICAPFVIYVILSVISLLGTIFNDNTETGSNKVVSVVLSVLGMTVFGALYYWLCSVCKKTTAWIILLFPIIFYTLLFIVALGYFASTTGKNETDNQTN